MAALIAVVISAASCGGGESDSVLRVDARFDPDTPANVFRPISETSRSVAQTFTVGREGRLSEIALVITDGESTDDGTIRVLIQPVHDGDFINQVASSGYLSPPLLVDTRTLPASRSGEFTIFELGDARELQFAPGKDLALVVDFVSRETNDDPTRPIAQVLGQSGSPYPDGAGATGTATDLGGGGFSYQPEDYFFRTFMLTR